MRGIDKVSVERTRRSLRPVARLIFKDFFLSFSHFASVFIRMPCIYFLSINYTLQASSIKEILFLLSNLFPFVKAAFIPSVLLSRSNCQPRRTRRWKRVCDISTARGQRRAQKQRARSPSLRELYRLGFGARNNNWGYGAAYGDSGRL